MFLLIKTKLINEESFISARINDFFIQKLETAIT